MHMDRKLEKWIRWLKVVHDDVQQMLVKQNIFWDVQEIIKSNESLHQSSSFYAYLGDTYVAYICTAIRRQVKCGGDSISFSRLLSEIIESPEILSRKYYKDLYVDSVVADRADFDFDKFAGEGCSHISKSMVESDLNELREVSRKIEGFTDRRIAHHDKRSPSELPRFEEVDQCIGLMDKLYVKYHLIFHASSMDSLMPTYQYNWKEIFEIPWIAEKSEEHS